MLKAKDTYRIDSSVSLSSYALNSLVSLYQPIMGHEAVALYLVLVSEGQFQRTNEQHGRLCEILNMNIDVIEKARKTCESYKLIKTFYNEEEGRDSYIYLLLSPLNVESFFGNDLYAKMLNKALGQKQYEISAAKFLNSGISTRGYKEITQALTKGSVETWELENVAFSKVQPSYNFSNDKVLINFDYEKFLSGTSALVFPLEARTPENLQLIGQLASINGISPEKMTILVGRCINLETKVMNTALLTKMVNNLEPEITKAKDPYSLPPVAFLQGKQNGTPVMPVDRKLLESLSLEMKLPNEVINVLVDYVLTTNDNRLTKSYIEKIAGQWIRKSIDSKQKALEEINNSATNSQSSKTNKKYRDVLPAYLNEETPKKTDKAVNKDNLKQMLKEMSKKNG